MTFYSLPYPPRRLTRPPCSTALYPEHTRDLCLAGLSYTPWTAALTTCTTIVVTYVSFLLVYSYLHTPLHSHLPFVILCRCGEATPPHHHPPPTFGERVLGFLSSTFPGGTRRFHPTLISVELLENLETRGNSIVII